MDKPPIRAMDRLYANFQSVFLYGSELPIRLAWKLGSCFRHNTWANSRALIHPNYKLLVKNKASQIGGYLQHLRRHQNIYSGEAASVVVMIG